MGFGNSIFDAGAENFITLSDSGDIIISTPNNIQLIGTVIGGGSVTAETPPETPDSVTTAFTATGTPKWVVADGVTYFDGAGYSYSAPTVTMDVPPSQYIRIIL